MLDIQTTDASWLISERAAEAAWREQASAEEASLRQLKAAGLHAKRVNKGMRRREADKAWGQDSIISVLVLLLVVGLLVKAVI
jgi:hypothetical protein